MEEEASACPTGPCRRGERAWRLSKPSKQEEDEEEKKKDDDDE